MNTEENEHEIYGIDWTTPIDVLEPEEDLNEYREASMHFLRIISLCMGYILSSNDPIAASYGCVYALGLTHLVDNKSMRQVARELHLSYGTISNHAKTIRQICGLPPSILQNELK